MTSRKNEKLEQQLEDWRGLKDLGDSLTKVTGGTAQNIVIARYLGMLRAYNINYGNFTVNRPARYTGKK